MKNFGYTEDEARKIYRDSLPHGSKKIIAERANVSPAAVSEYLSGRIYTSVRIERVIIEYLRELNKERNEFLNQLEKDLYRKADIVQYLSEQKGFKQSLRRFLR